MLNLLFDVSWAYDIVVLVVLALAIYACIKVPKLIWFFGTIACALVLASAVYSCVNIYKYTHARGGLFGTIDTGNQQNQLEVEDLTFEVNNLVLRQDENNVYCATMISDSVIKFDDDKDLIVYVNDVPCSVYGIEADTGYFFATYCYTFEDKNKNIILTDTLDLKFAFYGKCTELYISTNGGAECAKLWNSYFNKNEFVLKLSQADYVYSNGIEIVEGDVSNFAVAYFYVDGSLYYSQIYTKGTSVNFLSVDDNYNFLGWKTNPNGSYVSNYTINENTNFYADVTYKLNLTLESPTRFTAQCRNVDFSTYSMTIYLTYQSYSSADNGFKIQTKSYTIDNKSNNWTAPFDFLREYTNYRGIYNISVNNGMLVMQFNSSSSENIAHRFTLDGPAADKFYIMNVRVDNLSFN